MPTADTTARLQAQLQSLWNIARLVDATPDELCATIVEEIQQVSESDYAFFGFVNDEQTEMVIQSWSNATSDACRLHSTPMHYPFSRGGVWVRAATEQRAIIINDMANEPGLKGTCPCCVFWPCRCCTRAR